MLFTQHINALTASVDGIQSQIESLESQLRTLRSHKAGFESELQQILTLEGAAESALNQSQMFVNAAESLGRTDLIETFWESMDAMQSPVTYQLPESPEPDTDTPKPEPINPIEPDTDDTDTITVDPILESPEPDTDTPESEPDTTPESEPRNLASVGCAVFNPSTADFDNLKAWVRSHQGDDKTRLQGTLTRRTTWEYAAKLILENLIR
jgi:hypothetical protein